MPQLGPTTMLDRAGALERFATNRRRTRALFDLLDESVYYERPISLRNPVIFYEGHIPAFSVNTLIRKALGRPGIDERRARMARPSGARSCASVTRREGECERQQ